MKRFLQPLLAVSLTSISLIINQEPGFAQKQTTPDRIESLAVRIETDDIRGAGTDNAVYLDIGPLSWKLNLPHHNDFKRRSSVTYELIRNRCNLQTKKVVNLNRSDILWRRLHKKGIGGVTGLGDGFDGAWHPHSLTLIVNGIPEQPIVIDEPLNSRCWYWRSENPYLDLATFARSLRVVQNRPLRFIDKASGILTTNLFKKRGISGWLSSPYDRQCFGHPAHNPKPPQELPPVCVSGSVLAHATSSDGLETIDLKVTRIEGAVAKTGWQPSEIDLTDSSNFPTPRYIRIENSRVHHRVDRLPFARICGELKWDTDFEGWWEVHPRRDADLPPKTTTR